MSFFLEVYLRKSYNKDRSHRIDCEYTALETHREALRKRDLRVNAIYP